MKGEWTEKACAS